MVSILPGESNWDLIGKMTGQGISQNFPGGFEKGINRGMLRNSIDEITRIASNPNSTPLDISAAAMKAGAGIPGSERYLGALIPELVKFAEARRLQQSPQAGEQVLRNRENLVSPQSRQQLPGFLDQQGQESEFFPNNVGPQGGPGNVPQAATTGNKVPIPTPQEELKEARSLASERTKSGIPTTPQQALEEVKAATEHKRIHNREVDKELEQRVTGQQIAGAKATDYLKRAFGKETPTPEMEAVFQKLGEEASTRGDSEADTNRYLAKEATKFKNTIENVKNDISAPRVSNAIQRKFLGTQKDFEAAAADARSHLKPLLDLGLYDTARNLLVDQGYYPEEREYIINPMGEREKTLLNQVPTAQRTKKEHFGIHAPTSLFPEYETNPNQIQNIKSGLQDLKKANPNFSLLLARKAFEDKKYDWRMFKDALNELQKEGFELSDDQDIQKGYLDNPPLNNLEKVLNKLQLIGR